MHNVTNNSRGVRTFNVKDGKDAKGNPKSRIVSLAPGRSADLDLVDPEAKTLKGRQERGDLTIKAAKGKVPEGGSGEPVVSYEAKHRGAGSYSIMSGDQEIVQGLTKEEADGFKSLSDEAKTAFVAERRG